MVAVMSDPKLEESRKFAKGFLGSLGDDLDLLVEVQVAIADLIRRYDPGPYENRFAVGGTIEKILGSAARVLGFDVQNAGANRQAYDLELGPNFGISVKSKFQLYSRSDKIRITNSQGKEGAWDTGTIFVLTGVGIGYADKELCPGIESYGGDSKSAEVAILPLLHLWGVTPRPQKGKRSKKLDELPIPDYQPGFFVPVEIPGRFSPPSQRVVSDPIAQDILSGGKTPRLLDHFELSI